VTIPTLSMQLTDMFLFRDGRIVFTGHVEQGPDPIPKCRCRLLVNEAVIAEFEIEGEMIPERTPASGPERSVSTVERVDVDPQLIRSGTVLLVCENDG
jgi:hypothetical protein